MKREATKIVVGFIGVCVGLWCATVGVAAACPTITVADNSIPADKIASCVQSGVILIDPKLKEQYPDIDDVIRKTCQTLNDKPWPKHQDAANITRDRINQGGIYLEWSPPNKPLKDLISRDGKLSGGSVAGNTVDANRIQLGALAGGGGTDYDLAQTLAHELTHAGKILNCRLRDRFAGAIKGAAAGGSAGIVAGGGGSSSTGCGASRQRRSRPRRCSGFCNCLQGLL